MSMLFAYLAGGEGVWWVLEVLKFFVRGSQSFLLALYVCVWGGGGGVRFSTSTSVKKK